MKSFINSNNDSFSSLNSLDLQQLIDELNEFYLEYRTTLDLSKKVTFGVEIEYEKLNKKFTDEYIKNKRGWTSKFDSTVATGGEITSPIMTDEQLYWKDLRDICTFLKKKKAEVTENAGGHIHIGANILGRDVNAWKNFLKVYTLYENVIFRFAYGENLNGRKGISRYAEPISDKLLILYGTIDSACSIDDIAHVLCSGSRYKAVNFTNITYENKFCENKMKNTIEFRFPNGTINEVIWQNNINVFAKLLTSVKEDVINMEYVDYRLKQILKENILYDNVIIKSALEFVDMIFDNNIDKVYFLKQYFKDYEETSSKELIMSKRFTR